MRNINGNTLNSATTCMKCDLCSQKSKKNHQRNDNLPVVLIDGQMPNSTVFIHISDFSRSSVLIFTSFSCSGFVRLIAEPWEILRTYTSCVCRRIVCPASVSYCCCCCCCDTSATSLSSLSTSIAHRSATAVHRARRLMTSRRQVEAERTGPDRTARRGWSPVT